MLLKVVLVVKYPCFAALIDIQQCNFGNTWPVLTSADSPLHAYAPGLSDDSNFGEVDRSCIWSTRVYSHVFDSAIQFQVMINNVALSCIQYFSFYEYREPSHRDVCAQHVWFFSLHEL